MNQSDNLETFMESIQYISRMMKRNVRNQTLPYGITKTQWFILRILSQESCTVGELAEKLEVRSSSMSQMIDRLQLAGFVERQVDARDARSKVVKLSALGEETIEEINQNGIQLLATPFFKLTESERDMLVKLLRTFTTHLSETSHDSVSNEL